MKCATNTLLLLLGATASHAFVVTPSSGTTTALAGYHYRNGPDEDPSSTAGTAPQKGLKPVFSDYGTPEPRAPLGQVGDPNDGKGLKPVFGDFGTPEPKAPLGEVGEQNKGKGLNRVFADWEVGFSADGLQRPSS